MLVGTVPFVGSTPEEVFSNILKNKRSTQLEEGDNPVSESAAALVNELLEWDQRKRLGRNGAHEVRTHPFFSGVAWEHLRDNEPPFVPEHKDIGDTAYFPARKTDPPAEVLMSEYTSPRESSTDKVRTGKARG